MKKDPLVFIKHILEAIKDIENSTKNISKKEFIKNKDIKDATIRRIEVIGEAVKNIPQNFRKKYSRIEWNKIAGTRDKLIHHYFGVDLDAVFDMVKEDLPELKKHIEEILSE